MIDRRRFLIASAATLVLPRLARASAVTVRSGSFVGQSRHVTSGTGSLVREGDSWSVVLGPDFSFDGAPDPKVALGHQGYDPRTVLGPLASDSGAQSYPIPQNIRADAYTQIWIWCERFSVPLGVAELA